MGKVKKVMVIGREKKRDQMKRGIENGPNCY